MKFSLLDTPERFYEESSTMNHCVKTYCTSVANGHYIIYSVEDLKTGDRATLSVGISTTFIFNQLKAKNNAKSPERIINCVKDFVGKFFNIIDFSYSDDLNLNAVFYIKQPEDVILENNNLENEALFIEEFIEEDVIVDEDFPELPF